MNSVPQSKPVKEKSPLHAFYFHPPFTMNFWADILDEVYKKQVYFRFIPKQQKGTICIDVGANVGLCTYYFAKYFGTVFALEPAEIHYEALTSMVKQNNLSNVTTSRIALSNKDGSTKFYHNDNQTMFSMESNVNKQDDFEEVPTISLEVYMKKYKIEKIDLLKLDVEGSECLIINSDGFKNVADKIKVIAGEFHDWAPCSQANFQHCLEDLGYTVRWRRDTQAKVFEAERV